MLDLPQNRDSPPNNGLHRVRFGEFEADLRIGEVRKAGSRVKLQDQPFKVLQILLENPGNIVSREELQSRIWPEESYGDFDHAVNVAVGKLRTALGDSAENPSFIETVPRRGYRFVAAVQGPPALPPAARPSLPASTNGEGKPPIQIQGEPSAVDISGRHCECGAARGRRVARAPKRQVAARGDSAPDYQPRDRLFRPVRAGRTECDLCRVVGRRAG